MENCIRVIRVRVKGKLRPSVDTYQEGFVFGGADDEVVGERQGIENVVIYVHHLQRLRCVGFQAELPHHDLLIQTHRDDMFARRREINALHPMPVPAKYLENLVCLSLRL